MEYKVIDHFKNKELIVSDIYEKLISECEKFGTVYQSPKKTSIHLDAKSSFVGVYTRKDCLLLHIHTDFDIDNSRIEKLKKYQLIDTNISYGLRTLTKSTNR